METRVIEMDPLEDCRKVYREAADLLAAGELVAIPTETVYGLGADAFNADAVAKVFAVKERPSFDPLICHLANARALKDIAAVPEELQPLVDKLAKEFWPGPMTLVLPRAARMPGCVRRGCARWRMCPTATTRCICWCACAATSACRAHARGAMILRRWAPAGAC